MNRVLSIHPGLNLEKGWSSLSILVTELKCSCTIKMKETLAAYMLKYSVT